jgi:hypothetical protein
MPTWWEQMLHIVSGRTRSHDDLPDLRDLPSRTVRVERTHYVVNDRERRSQEDRLYVLRHEASRRRGGADVAVYSNGRGVGYLPRAVSAGVAPLLDAVGGAAVVNGIGSTQRSIRLRVEVPTDEAWRRFSRLHAVADQSPSAV